MKGAFDVTSTTDISSSCAQFQKLAPKRSGGGGQIQGSYKCESNNENANANPNGDSTSGSGGGRNNDDDNAGASVSASLPLAFGLVAVAGLVQALL